MWLVIVTALIREALEIWTRRRANQSNYAGPMWKAGHDMAAPTANFDLSSFNPHHALFLHALLNGWTNNHRSWLLEVERCVRRRDAGDGHAWNVAEEP